MAKRRSSLIKMWLRDGTFYPHYLLGKGAILPRVAREFTAIAKLRGTTLGISLQAGGDSVEEHIPSLGPPAGDTEPRRGIEPPLCGSQGSRHPKEPHWAYRRWLPARGTRRFLEPMVPPGEGIPALSARSLRRSPCRGGSSPHFPDQGQVKEQGRHGRDPPGLPGVSEHSSFV